MAIFDIYIAYVAWGEDGKRRPVLILQETPYSVTAFRITTHYEDKSETIRAKYLAINDWKQAGLDRQSYIDTNDTVTLSPTAIGKPIGRLTLADEMRLVAFMG
ncbi:MAG: type II toxin-antitoxin system PemK/MazF family toxin [Defluviitaleaceae bacterium]|nr:type II toxin-antitoxin system PemK/MazF family toxin [Defluviitaleaceae bacterium]